MAHSRRRPVRITRVGRARTVSPHPHRTSPRRTREGRVTDPRTGRPVDMLIVVGRGPGRRVSTSPKYREELEKRAIPYTIHTSKGTTRRGYTFSESEAARQRRLTKARQARGDARHRHFTARSRRRRGRV